MRIGITERGDAALDFREARVAAETMDGAILITKDVRLLKKLLKKHGFPCPYIIHATITGYGGTVLEPNVPPWTVMIEHVGPEDVLRIDPIICTDKGVRLAQNVLTAAKHVRRVRISFMDMYPHVKERFKQAGLPIPYSTFHAPLHFRSVIHDRLQLLTEAVVEVCAEPGLVCTGCVSQDDLATMGLDTNVTGYSSQRKECCCLAAKTELLKTRGQCAHGCLYCYWK